jgi:hypothetical protein
MSLNAAETKQLSRGPRIQMMLLLCFTALTLAGCAANYHGGAPEAGTWQVRGRSAYVAPQG